MPIEAVQYGAQHLVNRLFERIVATRLPTRIHLRNDATTGAGIQTVRRGMTLGRDGSGERRKRSALTRMVLTWRAMARSAAHPVATSVEPAYPPVNRTAVMSKCSCDSSAEQRDAAARASSPRTCSATGASASSARPSQSSLSNPAGKENNSAIAAADAQPVVRSHDLGLHAHDTQPIRQNTNHAHEYPIVNSRNGLPHTTTHRSSPGNQALHSISAENGASQRSWRQGHDIGISCSDRGTQCTADSGCQLRARRRDNRDPEAPRQRGRD